jgi:hypothetical protein
MELWTTWYLICAYLDIEFKKVIKHAPDRKFLAFLFHCFFFSFLFSNFWGHLENLPLLIRNSRLYSCAIFCAQANSL